MLAQGEQLRAHHVLDRHDVHGHGVDVELLGALEHPVVDRAAGRLEDDVDEDVAVPGLVEPLFGRILDPEARRFECLDGRFGVLRLDHKIEVVIALRPATGPGGQSAAEQERHVRFAQRCGGLLERLEEVVELGHDCVLPAGGAEGTVRL